MPYATSAEFLIPLLVIYFYWLIVFSFAGLYQHWFVRSRFDEFTAVVKAVSIGCFILFFVIFIDDALKDTKAISRFVILIYWALMIGFVGFGRVVIRTVQIGLLDKGIGKRNTIVIGNGQKANDLYNLVEKYPQLGYNILGFVGVNSSLSHPPQRGGEESSQYSPQSERKGKSGKTTHHLGKLSEVPKIIDENNVSEVLIALETKEKDKLVEVIRYCQNDRVHMKIMPDTYEIVSGMVKTNQIYGVPLIEVMPEIMPQGAKLFKRILDVSIGVFVLAFFFPLWLLIALMIKLTSKGPVFYTQQRVGRNGKVFTLYKFRSMIENAEEYGPDWTGERDPRITLIGRLIRRFYIDEVPQMINILRNEMSLVGPRPERPHLVEKLKKEFPYYYKRLGIKPGITGWAQIKHKYDSSVEDVRLKLQYDFYYIENMSLKLDFKIMANTLIVILLMKGH
jgi:exopolysaccharide biosynthesis polyprenyl glycosylphosphotransferase